MNHQVREAFQDTLGRFQELAGLGDERAWTALEHAHILSQQDAMQHVRVHWMMFCYAWRTREVRELVGQIPRLVLAAPASWLGRAPLGNSGRSNVGMFMPMSIPLELREILNRSESVPPDHA